MWHVVRAKPKRGRTWPSAMPRRASGRRYTLSATNDASLVAHKGNVSLSSGLLSQVFRHVRRAGVGEANDWRALDIQSYIVETPLSASAIPGPVYARRFAKRFSYAGR